MGYSRVLLDNSNEGASEMGVMMCKLECKCGKDVFELLSVEVIPRAEEASTQHSLLDSHFRE